MSKSQVLNETQKTARIFLDAMKKAIAQKRITLVSEIVIIHSESVPKIEVKEVSAGAGNSSLEAEENHGTAVKVEVVYGPNMIYYFSESWNRVAEKKSFRIG